MGSAHARNIRILPFKPLQIMTDQSGLLADMISLSDVFKLRTRPLDGTFIYNLQATEQAMASLTSWFHQYLTLWGPLHPIE